MKVFLKKAQETAGKVVEVAEETMGKAEGYLEDKTEIVKLEWELSKKKADMDDLFLKYGKLCYEKSVEDEETLACHALLVEAESELCSINADIEKLKEVEAQKAAQKEADKHIVFCTNCGKEYENGEKFCSKCGNKLNK